MNQSFTDGVQFAWDSTSMTLAEECLYKYKLRMLEGWRPRSLSTHLFFGGIYASCLEHYHKYRAEGTEHEEALYKIIREAMIKTWTYDACEPCMGCGKQRDLETDCASCNGTGVAGGKPWVSDHNTKTRENLVRTIVWYFEQFRDDPCKTVVLSDGRAAVEYSVRLPVDDGIIFSGHLDRLVDYSDKLYIQDQKTTASTITPRYFEAYNPNTQMSNYTFMGKAIFGLPVKGVMIDAAQIAVGFSRFERAFIFMDEGSLNEWYDDTMYHIKRAQQATRENYFPKNRSSCHKFAGCEFRGVCNKSPLVRKNFLKAEFEQQPIWDPLAIR